MSKNKTPKFEQRTKPQNSALHKLLGNLGFTDDDKAEMVFAITDGRTEHSSEMSFDECNAMIVQLGGTAIRSTRNRRTKLDKTNVATLVTPEQRKKLDELKTARNMSDAGFESLCKRMLKKSAPHTVKDAQKVIEAIKKMIERDSLKTVVGGKAA